MDAALELFRSGGYQKTMIIDITKKIGAAKGTFYHYYPSKEAIVQAICNRWGSQLANSFKLQSHGLDALPKLELFIHCLFLPKEPNTLFKRLWDEEHLNLYYKSWKTLVENIFNPLLTEIIQQGNCEGSMHVSCPQQAIAFFWSTLSCVWEAILFRDTPEVFAGKANMSKALLERILGIEDGKLELSLTNYGIA